MQISTQNGSYKRAAADRRTHRQTDGTDSITSIADAVSNKRSMVVVEKAAYDSPNPCLCFSVQSFEFGNEEIPPLREHFAPFVLDRGEVSK